MATDSPAGCWHSLALLAKGETSTVACDGQVLFTVADRAILGASRVILWTKADSVACFDT